MFYAITNLKGTKALASKMRRWSNDRQGYATTIRQVGTGLLVEKDKQPWAELAGSMTNDTQIYPCETEAEALGRLR